MSATNTSANSTLPAIVCDKGSMADSVTAWIPKNINYTVYSAHDVDDPAFRTCCAPNPVNLVGPCGLWCELPQRFADKYHAPVAQGPDEDFSLCLAANGWILGGRISSTHVSAATRGLPAGISAGKMALVLFVAGLVAFS